MSYIKQYPVRFYGLIVSLIALASAFGVNLSADQTGALTAAAAATLAFVTEKFTSPA